MFQQGLIVGKTRTKVSDNKGEPKFLLLLLCGRTKSKRNDKLKVFKFGHFLLFAGS